MDNNVNKHFVYFTLQIDYFFLHLMNENNNNHLHVSLNARLFRIKCSEYMDRRSGCKDYYKMNLDTEYYSQLKYAINGSDDGAPVYFKEEQWHTIDDWSEEPDKMLWHLKYYIDHRIMEKELDLVLSDDYLTAGKLSRFKVIEFFQGIVNDYSKLPPTVQPCPLPLSPVEYVPAKKKKDPFQSLKPTAKQGDLSL